MNILYLTYDGLSDPLGQSQVLPYLIGLSSKGHCIHIISFEKDFFYSQVSDQIYNTLKNSNITWSPLKYTKSPPVFSTIYDIIRLKISSKRYLKNHRIDLVHCRSYITSLIGLYLKKKRKIPFLFDMRGLWADERVDGKIWNLKNPLYNFIFRYFKRKEKEFFFHSNYVISLTYKGKEEIHRICNDDTIPIKVIPCCVDTTLFDPENIEASTIISWKKKISFEDGFKYLVYVGSIGTWYMLDEMMQFFKTIQSVDKKIKFLFITTDNKETIENTASKYSIDTKSVIIVSAFRSNLPSLLSLCDASVFFIKPAYSKIASSPTKQAELLSMGIPVICNDGIGDSSDIVRNLNSGLIISELREENYIKAIPFITKRSQQEQKRMHKAAMDEFSLSVGVERYHSVYHEIINSINHDDTIHC